MHMRLSKKTMPIKSFLAMGSSLEYAFLPEIRICIFLTESLYWLRLSLKNKVGNPILENILFVDNGMSEMQVFCELCVYR